MDSILIDLVEELLELVLFVANLFIKSCQMRRDYANVGLILVVPGIFLLDHGLVKAHLLFVFLTVEGVDHLMTVFVVQLDRLMAELHLFAVLHSSC